MDSGMIQILLVVNLVLLIIFAVLLLLTIRQVGILSLRLGPVGSRTTNLGPELGSNQANNEFLHEMIYSLSLNKKINVLLAFVDPDCGGCRILFPALRTVAREQRDQLLVVALVGSSNGNGIDKLGNQLGKYIHVLDGENLYKEWSISGTPYCVILDENLKVAGKGVTNTVEHLESLLNTLEFKTPTMEDYIIKINSSREDDFELTEAESPRRKAL